MSEEFTAKNAAYWKRKAKEHKEQIEEYASRIITGDYGDGDYREKCKQLDEANALIAMQDRIIGDALRVFEVTQDVKDYGAAHWSNRAVFALANTKATAEAYEREVRSKAIISMKRDLQAVQEDGGCLCSSCAQYVERVVGHMVNELSAMKGNIQ